MKRKNILFFVLIMALALPLSFAHAQTTIYEFNLGGNWVGGGGGPSDRSIAVDMTATTTITAVGIYIQPTSITDMTLSIYALSGTTRGAQLASNTVAVSAAGALTWIDIPINFTFQNGQRYDISFWPTGGWSDTAFEWHNFDNPLLDPGNGIAFGPFLVLDGAYDSAWGNFVAPHVRVSASPEAEVEAEAEPVPGCDVLINIPEQAVVGTFTDHATVYWMPGEATYPPLAIDAGKSYWVAGLDETGQFYKVLVSCEWVWVEVGTVGPNYDAVWNGTPLPTEVVE